MREIKFRAWNKVEKVMYTDAINNCKDSFNMILKHLQIYDVMQFTGLKDKNGAEIYKGDIVLSHNITYICKWNRYRCEFAWYSLSNDYIYPIGDARLHLEVIGNVWENPDLLEGGPPDAD